MEKGKLSKFINKYSLGGLVESVKWESNKNSLLVNFISDDKSVLGNVTMTDFNYRDISFGVYDTTKLTKMLSVLGTDVDFEVTEVDNKSVSLKFKDDSTSVNYMVADLSVIPTVPSLNELPEFDIEVKLDNKFINNFIRAKAALSEEESFTFLTKNGKSQIILGYSSINTNRIIIDVDAKTDGDVEPVSYSASYLKEILSANKEANDAILNISTQGLAHIHFKLDEYESNYYLVQKQS